VEPLHVADSGLCRPLLCLHQHVAVGIKPGRLLKPRRQQQREVAGTAPDIEQAARAIKRQLAC
jgi:hypothetical protein